MRAAVCLAGGLRHLQRCTARLQPFLMTDLRSGRASTPTRQSSLAFFLASWYDREVECVVDSSMVSSSPSLRVAVEFGVRRIFKDAKLTLDGLWLGSSASAVARGASGNGIPAFLYAQYTLWARCMDMVDPSFDFVVKARPDLYFLPQTTSLSWGGRSQTTQQPVLKLFGQRMLMTESAIFAFISPFYDGAIDDTLVIGTTKSVRAAIAGLKRRIDSGALIAKPNSAAEWIFQTHVEHSNLTRYCMGGRRLFTKLEICSRCIVNGSGIRYGTFGNNVRNMTWQHLDVVRSRVIVDTAGRIAMQPMPTDDAPIGGRGQIRRTTENVISKGG